MSTTTTTPPQPPADPAPSKSGRRSSKEKPPKGKAAKAAKASASKVARPGVASVNLLSPWVFEELRVHQLRRRFMLGLVVLVVAIALVWSALRFNLHRTNEDLRGEQAVGVGLTNKLRDLGPVKTYVDGVTRRVITVKGATYDDVAFSRVLGSLDAATPDAATISTISVELAAAEPDTSKDSKETPADKAKKAATDPARGLVGNTCPGPDPFGTKVVVGCVTITGTAASRDAVSALVIALGGDKLFVEPFVDTTTTEDSDAVTFSGSVGLSPAVFSGRYDTLGDELTKGAKK